ncbi:PsiF family protein [Dankookia sp. GCM10030260]|uniref:PsiF family protein n=1 Tax=Dankookia sp. GCM10030260 TaxID=3273390 RepID=UPI00361750BD
MRRLVLSLALLVTGTLPTLGAEPKPKREPTPAQQAQHEKMRQCNATAKARGLHADPRKAFMKECLAKQTAG